MGKKLTRKQRIARIVIGALRETIRVHGIINKRLIGSAAKRITGTLIAEEKKHESIHRNAK